MVDSTNSKATFDFKKVQPVTLVYQMNKLILY